MKARSKLLKHGLVLLLLTPQMSWAKDDGTGMLGISQIGSNQKAESSVGSALKTYFGFNNAEIVKQNTRSLLLNVEGLVISSQDVNQIQAAVRSGDTVVINYELTESESVAKRIGQIEAEISEKEKIIQEAKDTKAKLLAKENLSSYQKTKISHMDSLVSKNEVLIQLQRDELNKVKTGQLKTDPRRVVTLTADMDQLSVEKFLLDRLDNQTRLVAVKALSAKGAQAVRLARLRGAGAVGLVALMLGGSYVLLEGRDDKNSNDILVFKPELIQPAEASEIN